ncbi:Structural maintenance of chromosomes protein 3 [Galdieria sulphuraria]|nr:Structural maintenance of chromosomes protein 3 [Galdieria sulphuraria]
MQRNQNKLKKKGSPRTSTEKLSINIETSLNREKLLLIETLDNRKDEDISRTFRTVREHFSKLFDELVPGGKARLVMKYRGSDSSRADSSIFDEEKRE